MVFISHANILECLPETVDWNSRRSKQFGEPASVVDMGISSALPVIYGGEPFLSAPSLPRGGEPMNTSLKIEMITGHYLSRCAILLLVLFVPVARAQTSYSAKDYCQRAHERRERGQFKPSIADYDRAIELDPRLVHAFSGRGAARKAIDVSIESAETIGAIAS